MRAAHGVGDRVHLHHAGTAAYPLPNLPRTSANRYADPDDGGSGAARVARGVKAVGRGRRLIVTGRLASPARRDVTVTVKAARNRASATDARVAAYTNHCASIS